MRMFRSSVHFQLLEHLTAETRVGEHPPDGVLDNSLRILLHEVTKPVDADTARIPRVAEVFLQLLALSGHPDLPRVDDDDEIAKISVGSKLGFVLSAKQVRHLRRNPAQGFALSIDEMPLLVCICGFEISCGLVHDNRLLEGRGNEWSKSLEK
jgi:hypothetical protein